jgi:superfamily II DNA or RNA helicase
MMYNLVLNFYLQDGDIYLPDAYIVTMDKDGSLAHVKQKAFLHTVESFGIEVIPHFHKLFGLIELLTEEVIVERFKAKKKKTTSLKELLVDPHEKKKILQYIDEKMSEFVRLAVESPYAIALNLDRRVLVKDFLIKKSESVLQPLLFFKKTDSGIEYQLKLALEETTWTIQSRSIVPVANQPGWIIIDNVLYKVAHINANLVKPFKDKEKILIPAGSVKSYFQKFILKVVALVDIEAEGFEVFQDGQLKKCIVQPVKHLFKDTWIFLLHMDYGDSSFLWTDAKNFRTRLDFNEDEEIRIIKINRDRENEHFWKEEFLKFGVQLTTDGYFECPWSSEDPYNPLAWLAEKKSELEKSGFLVQLPSLDYKSIVLSVPTIQLGVNESNDWFDLHGVVTVGDHSFPFKHLIGHIRNLNRQFELPDGTIFIIPQEWMARFSAIAQFSEIESHALKIGKNQFPLIKDLGFDQLEILEEDYQSLEYTPSSFLRATLRPYQIDGVKWLIHLYLKGLGGCLADDMGLGKTLQTLALLLYIKEQKPSLCSLIVLPASLVFNWEKEIKKFAPILTVNVHVGTKRQKDPKIIERFDIILTTYQTVLRDVELFEKIPFEYIILDESQQIKNRESKIFKSLNELTSINKLSLSGTPIENSLSDLWSQMQFINPNLLGTFPFFRNEFIYPVEKLNDEEKKSRLKKLVNPYLLRRTKEQVAQDLPELTTSVFYAEMTPEQKQIYEREKSAARNYLLDSYAENSPVYKLQVLKTLTKLRQLVNHPAMVMEEYKNQSGKFQDVIEHWEVIRKSGHKVLFFSSFVKHLELFRNYFEENNQSYSWISGQTSLKDRAKAIEDFETYHDARAFLISIKSGGSGLNLTAADYVFILDPWWNPFIEQQAIARAHRIGQTKKVMAIRFITSGSIEEKILMLQDKKSQLAADIIQPMESNSLEQADIEFLLS